MSISATGKINESIVNNTIIDPPYKQHSFQRQKKQYNPGLYHQPVYPVQLIQPLKNSVISEIDMATQSIMTSASYYQLFFYQSLGMFIFIFGLTCFTSLVQFDSQVQLCILFAIILSGYLSGANLNPAVTLSNVLRKQNKYAIKMFFIYFAAQLLGTAFALLLAQFLNDIKLPPAVPLDTDAFSLIRIVLSQLTGTFVLVFFILQVSNPNTTFIQNQLSGFVSIVIFIHIARIYAISSGNLINTAVGLGLALISGSRGDWRGLEWFWLWAIGDILGAITATVFYDKFFEPTIKFIRQQRRQNSSLSIGSDLQFSRQDF